MSPFDVTLVNVSTPRPYGEEGARDVSLPLGSLYLVSALERAGIKVEFRDYQLFGSHSSFPLDVDRLQAFLADSAPILGISCMISMLPFVIIGTKKFKESHPRHTIILGGPGPSGVARAIISSLPWVDVVGRGEGEETIVELVRALKDGGDLTSVQGITYRCGSEIHHNAARPRIRNLDEIPLPAYEKVNLADYEAVSIISGRGCPFRCAFCDVGPLWGNRTSFRSIDGVIEEMELLKNRYGQKTIHIADDTFDLRRDRTEKLCGRIEGLGINWSCCARVDLIDEALLERMAKAGCSAIFLGIESGSDAVLKKINKGFTIKEATQRVELSTKYIKKVITSFIWGFPFETMDDFKSTIFSVVSMWHLGAFPGLKLLSPMPLSQLGTEYRDQLEFSEDLCSVFASLGNMVPGRMTKRAELPEDFKEIIRTYPEVFMGFYYIKSDGIREKLQYLKKFSEKRGLLM